MKKALVIGGTGATGRQLIKQLLISKHFDKVTSIGRAPVLNNEKNIKLQDIVIRSLYNLSDTIGYWEGHDVFFNCIGTTRKRAKSAHNFIQIEEGISMEAAKYASKAKIPHASIISAAGANANQWAHKWIHPLLYMQTMGKKEQTVINSNFDRVSIFRPGLLIRLQRTSFLENFIAKQGFGLRVDDLASAMINDVNNNNTNSAINYYYNNDIKDLNSM